MDVSANTFASKTDNDETIDSPSAVHATDTNYWYDRLHPDFQYMRQLPQFNLDSWLKTNLLQLLFQVAPSPRTPDDITKEKIPQVGVYYYPKNCSYKNRAPAALLWIHSGGRIVGAADSSDDIKFCQHLCKELDVPVLSASYRLAPNHPFPAALDDVEEAYKYLVSRVKSEVSEENKQLPVKIAVAGDSAGGGLAAELSQKLLDKSVSSDSFVNPPVAQLLIYPMLDDRTCVDKQHDRFPPHILWNNTSNTYGWSSYLGENYKPGDEIIPDYASASRRKDLSNLPPAYIVCGSADLFLSECRDYASRLKQGGVYVEYEEIIGGCHGMINMCGETETVIKIWQKFVSFGKSYLMST